MAQVKAFSLGGLGAPCCCGGGPPPCPCNATICVEGCEGTILADASVVIKSGSTVVASGTTNSLGCVTLCIGTAGSYEVIVTYPAGGYYTYDNTLSLACGDTYTVKLVPIGSPTYCCVTFNVSGCCGGGVVGATITIGGATITTGADGSAVWCGTDPGSYPYSVCADRYACASGTYVISSVCNSGGCSPPPTIGVALSPASGYECGGKATDGSGNSGPIPTTLTLSDSVYGGASLSYTGGGIWTGQLTVSGMMFSGCTPTFTLYYSFNGCGNQLLVSFCVEVCGDCKDIFGNITESDVPGEVGCSGPNGSFHWNGLAEIPSDPVGCCGGEAVPDCASTPAYAADCTQTVTATYPPLDFELVVGPCPGGLVYPSGVTLTITE